MNVKNKMGMNRMNLLMNPLTTMKIVMSLKLLPNSLNCKDNWKLELSSKRKMRNLLGSCKRNFVKTQSHLVLVFQHEDDPLVLGLLLVKIHQMLPNKPKDLVK